MSPHSLRRPRYRWIVIRNNERLHLAKHVATSSSLVVTTGWWWLSLLLPAEPACGARHDETTTCSGLLSNPRVSLPILLYISPCPILVNVSLYLSVCVYVHSSHSLPLSIFINVFPSLPFFLPPSLTLSCSLPLPQTQSIPHDFPSTEQNRFQTRYKASGRRPTSAAVIARLPSQKSPYFCSDCMQISLSSWMGNFGEKYLWWMRGCPQEN